ncbi:unnamed protein product, partial [marine sediment metagenome]
PRVELERTSITPSITGVATAEWTTDEKYTGDYSVKLTAPTSGDYAKVKITQSVAFSSITDLNFYYMISNDAVATTEDIGATWPIYVRSGETVAQEYLSAYPVIHIKSGDEEHWIIGQPWAESVITGAWVNWNNTQASLVYTEALWHMEDFTADPEISGIPAGWGPLSYWTTTKYSDFEVVDIGIGLGLFAVTGQQSAYVDDLTIHDITYKLEQVLGFNTIQDAIDAALPGDTVLMHNGTYSATSSPFVRITTDSLTLMGESRDGVILDGT